MCLLHAFSLREGNLQTFTGMATAAHVAQPVDFTAEALPQRLNERAVAFLQDLRQTAFTKLHTGDPIRARISMAAP